MIEKNKMTNTRVNQTMTTSRLTIQVCIFMDILFIVKYVFEQMDNNDDFGQYDCIAENTHGRMEAIVSILRTLLNFEVFFLTKQSTNSILEESTTTSMKNDNKIPRYSKQYPVKMSSHRPLTGIEHKL